MGALKKYQQMDLFPELVVAYRAEQFRKIRVELEEVQRTEAQRSNVQLMTIRYSDKPKGLKNIAIRHDDWANELSEALRSGAQQNSLLKSSH